MNDVPAAEGRAIEIEIEVPGSPEEVWQAVATGPGVSSWYVPHRIEEREGGAAEASFGPGMEAKGRVAAWEPPRRFTIAGEPDGEGLVFEWTIEPRDVGVCVVRLRNSGFEDGDDWDARYQAMAGGWEIFLTNLRLHLEYFAPEPAAAMVPMAVWSVDRDRGWAHMCAELGLRSAVGAGDRITVDGSSGAPSLSGVVVKAAPLCYSLLVDAPASGTGFICAEGHGEETAVSTWFYLYGAEGRAAAERDEPRWREWLELVSPDP